MIAGVIWIRVRFYGPFIWVGPGDEVTDGFLIGIDIFARLFKKLQSLIHRNKQNYYENKDLDMQIVSIDVDHGFYGSFLNMKYKQIDTVAIDITRLMFWAFWGSNTISSVTSSPSRSDLLTYHVLAK